MNDNDVLFVIKTFTVDKVVSLCFVSHALSPYYSVLLKGGGWNPLFIDKSVESEVE